MSETARRKIELVVEVNIEQSKRALRTVTEDAEKATKDITKAAEKGAKSEVDIAIAKAREIARVNAGLDRQRSAAYKTAEREAAAAARKELQEAKQKAAEIVRITAMAEREKARLAREAEQARQRAIRESVALEKAAMRELAQNEKQATREAAAAAAARKKEIDQQRQSFGSLGGVLKTLGAAYTGLYVVNSSLDWAKEGAQIAALSKSYAHIGFTAKDLEATMAKLGYTLDTATVQRMSNLAHSFNFGQKEIQRFAEIARAASVKTGQDIKWMFESIVTGTARQSRLILDNLGILIRVKEANERYAKSLGTTADKLTDVQKKQAFVNEVMIQGQKIINDAPLDPLSQKIGRVSSAWKELGNSAKVALATIAGGVIEAATGNYINENKSRAEQATDHWREQYRARKALEKGGADSIYSSWGDTYGSREELNRILDLVDANKQLRDQVLGAAKVESERAAAAEALLARLREVEDRNWKAIKAAERTADIAKDNLKYLAQEQDLRAKIDELKGNGLSKQEEETLSLKDATKELERLILARAQYNALLRNQGYAARPDQGAVASGREFGVVAPDQGGRAAGGQGSVVRRGGGNDPNAVYPGNYVDNALGQRAVVESPAETLDQAQRQEQTKKRDGRSKKDRRNDIWLPNVVWNDPDAATAKRYEREIVVNTKVQTTYDDKTKQWLSVAGPEGFVEGATDGGRVPTIELAYRVDFSEFELASGKVKDIYQKTYEEIAKIEEENAQQTADRRAQEIAEAYESNKRSLFYSVSKKNPTLGDYLMDTAGPTRTGLQADLDAGRYSSAGKEADMAARDAAMSKLTPEDKAAFDQERLSVWQEGASEASFAWANFMEDAEPDRLKAIGDAMHEGIIKPTKVAADAVKELAQGFADTTAAAIFEAKGAEAYKRAANEFLKQMARKAAAAAIFEGAAALGSLAIQDYPGAVLHGKAAAAYGAVALVTGVGAAATGGWQTHAPKDPAKIDDKKHADRGGPSARTGTDGRMTTQISNVYYISYSGLSSDAAVRRMLMDTINSGVGTGDRIDYRVIEQR